MKTRSITGTTLLVDGGQHLLGLPRDASLMDGAPHGSLTRPPHVLFL